MAVIVIVTGGISTDPEYTVLRDLLEDYGHTVTHSTEAAAGSIAGSTDVILCVDHTSNPTSLASALETHMSTNGIPIGVGMSDRPSSGVNDSLPSLLGIVARITEDNVQDTNEYAMKADHQTFAPGAGFKLVGARQVWTNISTRTMVPVPSSGTSTAIAGSQVMSETETNLTVLAMVASGGARIPSVGGTFPVKVFWCGIMGVPTATILYGRDGGPLINSLVKWLNGDYDSAGFGP